jgi:hypothetical protein
MHCLEDIMRLVYEKTGAEVCIGDHVTTSKGEIVQVERIEEPKSPASSGRVHLQLIVDGLPVGPVSAFYPGVICAEWIEREDQP